MPPLNPSVPSGIDSGTQLLRNVALLSSAYGPRVPWGQSPVHRGICSLCLCRGSGSFLVGLPPFRPQAPSPSASVSLRSGSELCGPSPRTLPQAASGGFKQESDMMFEKE